MKNIKRILPILLCLLFAIGIMSACGKNAKGESSSAKGSDSSVTVADSGNSTETNESDDSDVSESKSSKSSSDKDSSKAKSDDSKKDTESGSASVSSDKKDISNSTNSNDKDNSEANSNSKSSSSKASSDNSSSKKSSNSNSKKITTATKKSDPKTDKDSSIKNDPINVDDARTFVITTYSKQAPETCKNFDKLVKDGFYNGLRFYRVINNFLAETGDPNNNGTGGSGKTIKGEFMANGVDNRLSHTKGVVSMQRKPSDKNSADSKFFICYNDNCKFMDGNYAAFGKVTEGMSVVDSFISVDRVKGNDGSKSLPVTPITITRAEYIGKDSNGDSQYKFYVTF